MRRIALAFLCLVWALGALAQGKTVTGKVTDKKDGSPLAGVSVTVAGAGTGAKTESDGTYSISVGASAKSLVFSFVGFETLTASIPSSGLLNVTLTAAENKLDEVVVVGYGTQRKRELTGSVAQIAGNKIKDLPVQSFDQALSGRAAGVTVTMPNGVLNNPPVIRVRGVNSISLSSFPLVVIDGIPTYSGNVGGTTPNNVLGDLNPSDIESMEVLKDAAAAAIYGSRASAGVLLITTKKGKQGRAKVNYDGWVGWTKAFNLIEMLNAQEYTDIKNEGLTNLGTPPNGTTTGFYTQKDASGNLVDTRWYDQVYRTGFSQNHSINASGASEKTNFFLSAAYTEQQGMLRGNDFKRLTARTNVDHKVNNWLTVGVNLGITNSDNFGPNSGSLPGQAFSIAGLGRLPLVLAPNVAPYNADGTYNINTATNTIGQGANKTALSFYNPAYILKENRFSSTSDRVLANGYAGIKLLNGLNFRTNYGIDYLNTINKEFRAALHGDGVQFGGAAQNTSQQYRRWNWQNTLQYMKGFGDHNINVLLGNEQQYTKQEGWGADRRGQADPFYDEFVGGFNTIVPAGNFFGENYLVSFFGRINYDYKGKYLLSVNGRRDGYSAFAPGKKYGNFYGASGGWVISQENFFQKSGLAKTISNLKMRGSYGLVGNFQGIGDYAFYSFFSTGLYGTASSLFFSQAGNTNLTWETSKKLDIGLELGFWNNRVTTEITYYNNNIDNLLLNDPQAPSRGIPGNSILTNIGRMVNNGLEFVINAQVIRKKDFNWNTSFNITTLANEVKALATGNADIPVATSGLETPSWIRVGESIGSFNAIKTGGVNPTTGQRIFYYKDGTAVQYNHAAPAASRWTYLDGRVAPRAPSQAADGQIIGPALPKWTGGWDNTFRYKGFDLNFLFFFSGGNYIYNGTKAGLRDNRNWNSAKEVTTRWQKVGDVTAIPRVVFGDNISNGSGLVISENVEKGDFLKLRNVSIGYMLPSNLLEKAKISSFRLYASVQNAFTLTNYSGFDPEISTNGNSNGAPSVDRNSVGQARTITLGINVGF